MDWQPTTFQRFIRPIPSSARTTVVETDAGIGYLKALGGPEGPNTLASELVATRLAKWFGLPTLDFAIMNLDECDEIPFVDRDGNEAGAALAGPAFITRSEAGSSWGGAAEQLRLLVNPADITRLVVFDTWTLNCDRYSRPRGDPPPRARVNLDNVFLSEEAPDGQFLLKAIDHTHCFACGKEWTRRLAHIDTIRDNRTFGLFPEFRAFLDQTVANRAASDLRAIQRSDVISVTNDIPREWDVKPQALDALIELILHRAVFVADTIVNRLWPQGVLFREDDSELQP